MLNKICFYFLLFIIYAFMGWLIEVIGKIITEHKFINRGFFIEPICPIYGWGCIALIILLTKYKEDLFVLFVMSIFICSVLEYLTSYFMEKIFHARWWDYSRRKFNLNGRICAETMIPFGVLSCLMMCIINPLFTDILLKIPANILNIISLFIFIVFLIDALVSFSIMFGFRGTLKTVEKDGTEEITKKVKEILINRNFLYKRLIKAFPSIIHRRKKNTTK